MDESLPCGLISRDRVLPNGIVIPSSPSLLSQFLLFEEIKTWHTNIASLIP